MSPEISLYEAAHAHLNHCAAPTTPPVTELVPLLIAQALADAKDEEDDAAGYALLAVELIGAFKLEVR